MRVERQLNAFVLSLFALTCGLHACSTNAEDCAQNGSCVKGEGTGAGSGGEAGSAGGGTTTTTACGSDADCDDGNPCTVNTCTVAGCATEDVVNGPKESDAVCGITCQGGEPELAAAGTLCEGDKVCDGAGSCVGCGEGHACPDGYGCASTGSCLLNLGIACVNDTVCGGNTCVEGICCAGGCEQCEMCDPQSFAGCVPVPANEHHSSCLAETESACDGSGECKNDVGVSCGSDADCASGHCSAQGLCALL